MKTIEQSDKKRVKGKETCIKGGIKIALRINALEEFHGETYPKADE